ncbi:GTP cyclohydrolase [Pandoravirus inopinatum]|uniref:GTP cyclohydrolase n=1 Tax=Pandoravirus inopinatum TaxID=1605721 RepID=A0A0B5JFB6_9VIRU|nr:GTP cyclohydrolase [Pandoravirus inopinatum]AJF98542.1 GTP cyclohydrolase [Pandoravirus inopinatum]
MDSIESNISRRTKDQCSTGSMREHDQTTTAAQPAACANAAQVLTYVSGNAEKRNEAERITADAGLRMACVSLPPDRVVPEVQGTVEEIVRQKCVAAYLALGRPVVVEDVALHFDALGGLPGPYARDFLANRALADVYALVAPSADRLGMTAVSALAFTADGDDVRIVVGQARGVVRDPAVHAHLPAWYPLVGRDRDDDARRALPCDTWASAAANDGVPCLHRVRAFDALARSLAEVPLTAVTADRRTLR